MSRINALLGLALLTSLSFAEMPKLVPMGFDTAAIPTLSLRAVAVETNMPAFSPLPKAVRMNGGVGSWQALPPHTRGVGVESLASFPAMDVQTENLSVSRLPLFLELEAGVASVSLLSVQVPELNVDALAISPGVQEVDALRRVRETQAGWDLIPFQIGRHSAMGELRVAANEAEARGDFEEAKRFRTEFWRLGAIMAARREAFAMRPVPTRGGVQHER